MKRVGLRLKFAVLFILVVTVALGAVLRPGDEMLSVTSKPYDTLEGIIGITGSHPGSRFHHADHRYVHLLLQGIQRISAGCIAGNHNRLYVLGFQKTDNLPRKPDNVFL